MKDWLPIGTIVELTIDEGALFMIAGYLTQQGDRERYDYFAVPFPYGLLKENQYISFNRGCITNVIFEGYRDEKSSNLLEGLSSLMNQLPL